jgi:hypothetical protein
MLPELKDRDVILLTCDSEDILCHNFQFRKQDQETFPWGPSRWPGHGLMIFLNLILSDEPPIA